MHPLSTALFLLGYALAIPVAMRMPTVVARQNRLGLFGHQAGMMVAGLGWLLRGQILVTVAHGIWLAIAYGWFQINSTPRSRPSRRSSRHGDSIG